MLETLEILGTLRDVDIDIRRIYSSVLRKKVDILSTYRLGI